MTESKTHDRAVVISGGKVHTPEGTRDVDVHIAGGVITAVQSGRAPESGAEVIDAAGMYVLPGAIDIHVHSRDPGFPDKEDFGTLTSAAAAGGVTTVIDMPNTVPAVDSAGVLEAKSALARGKARVDFGLWGLVRGSTTVDQLEGLAAAGAIGFKAYLGYPFNVRHKRVVQMLDQGDADLEAPPDYGTLARLAPTVAALGLPLVIHAEDAGILGAFQRPYETYADILAARPAEAEAVAISAAAEIAGASGARLHIAHLSSALGLAAAREAIRAGAPLSLETGPQYLWLCDQDFARLGTAMKMFPPIRLAADRDALVDGVAKREITIVASDHAPHTDAEKRGTLQEAPSGSPGVQTLYLSCLELAQRLGDVWSAPRWVSEGPARLIGLDQSKGFIAPGFDADIVIVDPRKRTLISSRSMLSRQRHGALDGLDVGFAINSVYSRGRLVASEGRRRGRAGGRMVRPARRR